MEMFVLHRAYLKLKQIPSALPTVCLANALASGCVACAMGRAVCVVLLIQVNMNHHEFVQSFYVGPV